jgi:hypothetical protein
LLRDYPNLAGLFILLRVTELLEMKGNRLVVCPGAEEAWRRMNFTEQYFALLEALLFQAHSSVLSTGRTREDPQAFKLVTMFLGQLSDRWHSFKQYESVRFLGPRGDVPPWNLFAQQQLGLIELRPAEFSDKERKYWGGRAWLVGGAKLTPWGTAATWGLLQCLQQLEEQQEQWEKDQRASDAAQLPAGSEDLISVVMGDDATEEKAGTAESEAAGEGTALEEAADEPPTQPEFGVLRPIFQPYFPEWQTVYARPNRAPRLGTHIFKVTLAGWRGDARVWRRLAVPPHTTLDELAGTILEAFKFDDDHLYDFRYRDQRGRSRCYNHPYCDEGPFTPDISVGETALALKDEMLFTYDYGDNWQFKLRLEQIEVEPSRLKRPKVLESAGKAPEQYPLSDGPD